MIETYDPPVNPKLGKHTAAFAASLPQNTSTDMPTIETLRASVTASLQGKTLSYPKNITEDSYKLKNIGEMNCYVLSTAQPDTVPTIVMFYGGGFCLNTLFAHKAFMANVAALVSCNIVFPDCPLAPETKAPEIIARSEAFLRTLLRTPTDFGCSDNMILMGWSSGSNLALTLALNLLAERDLFRKISQLILLSSWVDLSMQVNRTCPYQMQQNLDTIAAGADLLEMMARCYLPDSYKGTEPEFCPAYRPNAELKQLPPVTVIAGECEVLFGDSIFLADTLRRAETPTRLVVVEGQTHNYLVFNELSLDGVYVPDVIARLVAKKLIAHMIGKDGLGLTVKEFNLLS